MDHLYLYRLRFYFLFIFSFSSLSSRSLNRCSDDTTNTSKGLVVSGFLDAYYGYDWNRPSKNERPSFLFNHTRLNEFAMNTAVLKLSKEAQNFRIKFGLMAGTYPNANLASEPSTLRNIYEANMGFKISKRKNIWLDAGVFSSHLGFETINPFENLVLSRSLSSDNSPYYETGAKLTFESENSKWLFSGFLLNGWQHIQRTNESTMPSFGTQLLFKDKNFVINYSTFIGNEKPDSAAQWRYFHDVFFTLDQGKFHFIQGFDIGFEQAYKGSSSYNNWFVPTTIVKYDFTTRFAVAARYEFFSDEEGVILPTYKGKLNSGSINLDWKPMSDILVRIEGKYLASDSNTILQGNKYYKDSFSALVSLSARF